MKNTCAQSGTCFYCDAIIERFTPVQSFRDVEDSNPKTNDICAQSGTNRHVLAWRDKNATTQTEGAGSVPTGLVRRRSLLDKRRVHDIS